VARDGPLSEAAVRELGAALAEGLTAIHACGLIHRDLKPGNIILAADGPRIIDFGVARAVNASALTTMNAVIGTYGYMSPEQLGRRELTPRIGIFALGGVLVFAATGHGPFDAPDLPAVIGRILSEPPDLSPLAGSLRDVISACLDKEPGSRPALDDLLAYFGAADPVPWRPRVTPQKMTPAPDDGAVQRPAGQGTATTATGLPISSTVTRGPVTLAVAGPPLDAHAGPVTLVAFSPDGRLLGTAAQDGKIRLWDTGSWRQAGPALSPDLLPGTPRVQFEEVVFTPDGRALIAGASGGPAMLAWDVLSRQPLTSPAATNAYISPDGRFIAAEGKGAPLLWVWSPAESRYVAAFHLRRTTNKRIGFLAVFSPDGGLVAATDYEDSVSLWDTDTGERRGFLRRPCRAYSISGAAISPDRCFVAVHGETYDSHKENIHLLHLWDVTDSHPPQCHLIGKANAPAFSGWDIVFSADSRMLASTMGGQLRVWDTASRTHAGLGEPGDDAMLMFSPDNRLLADAGRFQLRFWDTATRAVAAAGPRITGTQATIQDAAFSPDGRLIATAEGSTARVWQVPAP
jgi:WD40 repeat protein